MKIASENFFEMQLVTFRGWIHVCIFNPRRNLDASCNIVWMKKQKAYIHHAKVLRAAFYTANLIYYKYPWLEISWDFKFFLFLFFFIFNLNVRPYVGFLVGAVHLIAILHFLIIHIHMRLFVFVHYYFKDKDF